MENENENANRFFKGPSNLFKWLGFEFKATRRWRELLLYIILCEMNISAAGQVISLAISEIEMQKTTENITFLNYYLVSLGKLVSLIYNRRGLHAIVSELRCLYPSAKVEKDYKLRGYLRGYLWMERILSLFFHSTTFLYNWILFFAVFFEMLRGKRFVYRFPLNIWSPIKISHTWYTYILMYIIEAHASYMSALTILATDLCLFSLLIQLIMHFNIVSENIRRIEPDECQEAEDKFKEQIIYHHSILKLTNKINSIFTPSILFSLLSSSMILCFTGYQLLGDVTIGTIVRLVILLIYEFKQVTITCFLGDRLMDVSFGVSNAIYEHKWYNGTKKYKQMVLIALIRSQQTVGLNIAGIAEVSKQTLRQVMSISYKIFAVLKT